MSQNNQFQSRTEQLRKRALLLWLYWPQFKSIRRRFQGGFKLHWAQNELSQSPMTFSHAMRCQLPHLCRRGPLGLDVFQNFSLTCEAPDFHPVQSPRTGTHRSANRQVTAFLIREREREREGISEQSDQLEEWRLLWIKGRQPWVTKQ